MHNLLILFCKIIGKPVAIYGASITPPIYTRAWARFLTRFCLQKADLVTMREGVSSRILVEQVGVKPEVLKVTADNAFLLPSADRRASIAMLEKNGIKVGQDKIIGVTIVHKTGILSTMSSTARGHVGVMSRFMDFIAEKTGAKIVLFPHSIGPTEADDDRVASAYVYSQSKHKDQVSYISGDHCASILKGMIGCCDFFIGERTHSVIAAVSMGVPSMSISFPEDYRTIGILGEMVGISRWIYNVKELDLLSLQELFTHAWNDREQIRDILHERIPQVIDMAHSNGRYLEEVLQRKGLVS
jgi:polysaccharide pyruvyl transferase WcaK-like protein